MVELQWIGTVAGLWCCGLFCYMIAGSKVRRSRYDLELFENLKVACAIRVLV
jgi:hypothetical protein